MLAGLAVAATVFWVLWGADETNRSKDFVSTPQFTLWLLILCGLSALLVLAAWPVTRIFGRLRSELRSQGGLGGPIWLSLVVGWVVLVGLVAFPLYMRELPWASSIADEVPVGDEWPLVRHELKLTTVSVASFLLAFLTIGGIWFVGIALGRMTSDKDASVPASSTPVPRTASRSTASWTLRASQANRRRSRRTIRSPMTALVLLVGKAGYRRIPPPYMAPGSASGPHGSGRART